MFKGFSPETVDFLWGIRLNNNREWFLAHKEDYVKYLYEPMKDLGKDLFVPFLDKPGNLLKVSRIYRDARLHHPLPYKESLWICIRKDVQWWSEHPCLFFEIRPEGVSYGLIWWQPKVTALKNFRDAISADPKRFLSIIGKLEKQTGVPISASLYKRPPQQTENKKLAPYFAWKGNIACTVEEEVAPTMFGESLGSRAGEFLEKLIPLYEYLCDIAMME